MDSWEEELDLLSQYIRVYIALLPDFIGSRINQLPEFQYFKDNYNNHEYSLIIPHYKEVYDLHDGKLCTTHLGGREATNGVIFRYYNIWMGSKYYLSGWIVDVSNFKTRMKEWKRE